MVKLHHNYGNLLNLRHWERGHANRPRRLQISPLLEWRARQADAPSTAERVPARFHTDPDTRQLVGSRTFTPDERERMLLKMVKAERGLYLEQPTRREYEIVADRVALRRNELGMKYLESGDYPKAFRNFAEAIAREPNLALAHNNLGLLYLEIGDLERARYYLTKAIELEPGLDIAYGNRALMFVEQGEYLDAYDDLEKAIELDPDEPLHRGSAGVLFLETGHAESALDCFEQAIELDPHNAMHYHNRGIAYEELGCEEEARADFMQAIELEEAEFEAGMEATYP